MARKSNKTAHVLSLLAGGDTDAKPAESGNQKTTNAPSNISMIDSSESTDLSSLIRDTLDKEITGSDLDIAEESEVNTEPEQQEEPSSPAEDKDFDPNNTEALVAQAVSDALDAENKSPEPEAAVLPAEQQLEESATPEPLMEQQPAAPADKSSDGSPDLIQTEDASAAISSPEISGITGGASEPASDAAAAPAEASAETTGQSNEQAQLTAVPSAPEADSSDSSQSNASVSAAAPEEKSPFSAPDDVEYEYIDVMNSVIDERLMEYIERFNVCSCNRCVLDVKALALSNLPPKFIVTPKTSSRPLMSFYHSKYSSYIMTELTKACLTVLDNPRH